MSKGQIKILPIGNVTKNRLLKAWAKQRHKETGRVWERASEWVGCSNRRRGDVKPTVTKQNNRRRAITESISHFAHYKNKAGFYTHAYQ